MSVNQITQKSNTNGLEKLLAEDPFLSLYKPLFILYCISLIIVLLWPFRFGEPQHVSLLADLRFELLSSEIIYLRDIIQNIVYFIPLSYLATALFWKHRHCSIKVILSCTAFSLCIEVLQHWIPIRFSSALDSLCNLIGAIIGTICYQFIDKHLKSRAKHLAKTLDASYQKE